MSKIKTGVLIRAVKDGANGIASTRVGDILTIDRVDEDGTGRATINREVRYGWLVGEGAVSPNGPFEVIDLLPLQEGDVIRFPQQAEKEQEYEVLSGADRARALVSLSGSGRDGPHDKGTTTKIGEDRHDIVLLRRRANKATAPSEDSWVAFVRRR